MHPDLAFPVWTGERQRRIEDVLDRALPRADALPARLHEAMRYAVLGGGKRIRPLLAYAAGEFADADPAVVDAPAAAVELIHAYSLVHDDLPCMDNDTLRRGKPTCHVAFGEATALLAGDALQSLAFGVLGESAMRASGAACATLATAAGRARHGGRPGDRPREFRHRAVVARTADDASDEDRRAHSRGRAAGRRVRTPADPRGIVGAGRLRARGGPGVPGRRRRTRRRGHGRRAGQDRRQGRGAAEADLRVAAGTGAGQAARRSAARGSLRRAGAVSRRARRLLELADWIVLRNH